MPQGIAKTCGEGLILGSVTGETAMEKTIPSRVPTKLSADRRQEVADLLAAEWHEELSQRLKKRKVVLKIPAKLHDRYLEIIGK